MVSQVDFGGWGPSWQPAEHGLGVLVVPAITAIAAITVVAAITVIAALSISTFTSALSRSTGHRSESKRFAELWIWK